MLNNEIEALVNKLTFLPFQKRELLKAELSVMGREGIEKFLNSLEILEPARDSIIKIRNSLIIVEAMSNILEV